MRKSTFQLTLLFSLGFLFQLHAQTPWCGVTSQDAKEIKSYMLQVREDMRDYVFDRNAVTYVPVRFYLVAKNDGTGRPSEKAALDALCEMNAVYEDQDIQFYLKEFKYVNNTSIHSSPTSFSGSNAIKNQMIYNALNIFIVGEISDPNSVGITQAYYQPPASLNASNRRDWVVVDDNYAGDYKPLSHEVGHFFGLPHPFNGWDFTPWDPAIHGNPVGLYSPDGTPNEFVNGSNCATAGDGICDTPADYLFGPSTNCTYNMNAKDPNGELLDPQEDNFMNYFECGEYHFTQGQKDEIKNSLFHVTRDYLRPGITPTLEQVTGVPTIISPSNQETIPTYNYVVLEWSEVPGANRYLVELINSTIGNQRFMVDDNQIILTGLPASKSFLWRVMAFNEYRTCGNFSAQRIFKTGDIFSDTSETPIISSWSVSPNPVRIGHPFTVFVESINEVEADVFIYTITGQRVLSYPKYSFKGVGSMLEIPTGNLQAGIYLVTLSTEEGMETKRIAIVD